MKPKADVWPFRLNFTVALALPTMWWLGFLCGWLLGTNGGL